MIVFVLTFSLSQLFP